MLIREAMGVAQVKSSLLRYSGRLDISDASYKAPPRVRDQRPLELKFDLDTLKP